jgi:hypothetical protein
VLEKIDDMTETCSMPLHRALCEKLSKPESGIAKLPANDAESPGSHAHEISEPLCAILLNTETGLRWLDQSELDVVKLRDLMRRILDDTRRASDIVARIRAATTG